MKSDPSVDIADLREMLGEASFTRGRAFANAGRVRNLHWNADEEVLSGTVIGNGGAYEVAAGMYPQDGQLGLDDNDCSCPIGGDCKHVAALVIAAATQQWQGLKQMKRAALSGETPEGHAPTAGEDIERVNADRDRLAWSVPLLGMLGDPGVRSEGTALAIELALEMPLPGARHDRPKLLARLMRPGARGGWVNGSLAWGALDDWNLHDQQLRMDHLEVARAFGETQRGRRAALSRYLYASQQSEKILDLSDWTGAQLWPLLDRATRAGMEIVHAVGGVGDVPDRRQGEVFFDVRADGGAGVGISSGLELTDPAGRRQRLDPAAMPVLFLGSDGHGLVLAEEAAGEPQRPANGAYRGVNLLAARLRLVRLARETPPELQQLVIDRGSLRVPAVDLAHFTHEIAPALRGIAPIRSGDDTFSLPEVSPPELILRVRHLEGHASTASWGWRYRVGEESIDVALGPGGSPLRDPGAEAEVLHSVDLRGSGSPHDLLADLKALGLLDTKGTPVPGAALMKGFDAVAFSTSTLGVLEAHDGLTVVVDGDAPDYRDVDDSVEIAIATHAPARESDWFDLNITLTVEGRELPLADVLGALARGESRMLLADGAYFSLAAHEFDALRQLIEEARTLGEGSTAGSLRISRYQAGLWRDLVGLGVVQEQAAGWQRAVESLLGLEALSAAQPPSTLTAELRHYQQEGFNWLATLWDLGLGGILADDMGLGKTLQALALICRARAEVAAPPFLVIAPTSVVPNWVAEAARFAPGLSVRATTDTLAKAGVGIDELCSGADIVVTTYNLLRLDAERYGSVPWSGLILDEAQAVKNHNSKAHAVVRRVQAPFKLAISGTPFENNLMELWSLLSIVAPGLFPDPAAFKEHFQQPIERDHDAERLALLRRRIRPLMMRRSKEVVADELPAKQEQLISVDLNSRHRKLYDTHLQRERQRILGLMDDFDANRFSILTGITRLRQMSLHAGLVDEKHEDVPSAKLETLSERLEEVTSGGHRALVFSQFTGFLRRVRERLDADGVEYCYLDGKTRRRGDVIERFKTGSAPVFVISLKAGGFGLNLTEADYCFLLDPWWNPAIEAQAVDRTHRIGQTRQVMVYRLVSAGTIEEKVVALARRKAKLFASVLDDGDLFSATVTADDIRGLLG